MKTRTVLLVCCLAGCTQDLKRVHTPELWTVSEKEAKRWSGAPEGDAFVSSVPSRDCWKIYSSLADPGLMIDGDPHSAAVSTDPLQKDQYVLVDLGTECVVHAIAQTHGVENGFPRRYRIDVAGDHNFPHQLRFVGRGAANQSVAVLRKPTRCRVLRITLLETCPAPWTIADLQIR